MNEATQKLQMEMANDAIKSMTPQMKEYQKNIAPLVYNYFVELINAGFTESQAISLVSAHGYMPPAPNTGCGQ
jgi:hypothetical protein